MKDADVLEDWSSNAQKVTVREGNGFLYSLGLRAKIDNSPDDVYK
jgi:hypothetical protein